MERHLTVPFNMYSSVINIYLACEMETLNFRKYQLMLNKKAEKTTRIELAQFQRSSIKQQSSRHTHTKNFVRFLSSMKTLGWISAL